jgi:aminoglycoside 2'-N-acetyltransferase I
VVELAHTAQLDPATLAAARALLDDVFGGEFTEADWEHSLGGIHALIHDDDGELAAHGAVVMRRLVHDSRALRAGYVEGVGVRASARRRGYGAAVMEALARVIAGAYDLGALGATDQAIALYERLGWRRWQGPLFALTPAGRVRTASDDGAVFVLEAGVRLDLAGELTCDWRDGGVW